MFIKGIETQNALKEPQTTNINERVQYTARTGIVQANVANGTVNGGGISFILLIGNLNGTLIKTITVKAAQTVAIGMIRLYIGSNIIEEIEIPSVTQSGIEETFSISLDVNYNLQNGVALKVSTQNAQNFNVFADALDWSY